MSYVTPRFSNLNAPATHPLAAAYFASAVPGLPAVQQRRINRMLTALKDAGIDSVLSDACFLRQGQNTETAAPKTLQGVTGALDGTPPWTSDGILLDGSTQHGAWATPAVSAHTLILDLFGAASGQGSDAVPGGLANSVAIDTAASLLQLAGTGSGLIYTRQGGTVTTTAAIGDAGQAFCVHYYNPLQQVVAITNDNAVSPTIKVWVDGFLSLTSAAANTQATSALNTVFVGARYRGSGSWDVPYKGGCAGWLLFNRVLTPTEVIAATVALRHLDDKAVNIVTYGDSLTTQLSDALRVVGNWPAQLLRTPLWAGRARLGNAANNGTTAASGVTNYAARVAQFAPTSEAVREGLFYCLYGTNDLIAGSAGATILASLKTIWRTARADGFKVIALTVPAARQAGYTAAQEAERVTLNAGIVAAAGYETDAVIDLDGFISTRAETTLFTDNYHPNNAGNVAIANFIINGSPTAPTLGNVLACEAAAYLP